jgi:nucleoid-associated protein YgaU
MAVSVKKVPLPSLSMFAKTPVYDVNGVVVLGLQQPIVLPATTDQIYTVRQGSENRLDRISFNFYGTSKLWWALAQVNNLTDPFLDVPTGTQLRIPDRARLPTN